MNLSKRIAELDGKIKVHRALKMKLMKEAFPLGRPLVLPPAHRLPELTCVIAGFDEDSVSLTVIAPQQFAGCAESLTWRELVKRFPNG